MHRRSTFRSTSVCSARGSSAIHDKGALHVPAAPLRPPSTARSLGAALPRYRSQLGLPACRLACSASKFIGAILGSSRFNATERRLVGGMASQPYARTRTRNGRRPVDRYAVRGLDSRCVGTGGTSEPIAIGAASGHATAVVAACWFETSNLLLNGVERCCVLAHALQNVTCFRDHLQS